MASLDVAIASAGYSCKAESRSSGSTLVVVYHIETLYVAVWQDKGRSP